MKDIYLTRYSVKGIKTIDQLVTLSFYKKTITRNADTQEYNVKGIYGMNGSGKSAIVSSVDILKNLLVNPGYLNNPIAQKNLDAMINKKSSDLFMEADYLIEIEKELLLFRYSVRLARRETGKYEIFHEQLSYKKAVSKNSSLATVFQTTDGKLTFPEEKEGNEYAGMIREKTMNLLDTNSMCALFYEKILPTILKQENISSELITGLSSLFILGNYIYIYTDQDDDHRDYFLENSFGYFNDSEVKSDEKYSLLKSSFEMKQDYFTTVSITKNLIPKNEYNQFVKTMNQLYNFLHIFKSDLQGIEIDRKENQDIYVCNLVMVYETYKIHAEFESTGIKKLIRLFVYLREMVQGGIVFIDEFDSNLHDVYLCALLEYLMEYGEGQLCFTTHNVGPMDILKQNKKSIDFLSADHNIYPWTANGNYSPSRLYRNGMIEGSPFNVDSIDFIGIFDQSEED